MLTTAQHKVIHWPSLSTCRRATCCCNDCLALGKHIRKATYLNFFLSFALGCEHNCFIFITNVLCFPGSQAWDSPAGGPARSGKCLRLIGQGLWGPQKA